MRNLNELSVFRVKYRFEYYPKLLLIIFEYVRIQIYLKVLLITFSIRINIFRNKDKDAYIRYSKYKYEIWYVWCFENKRSKDYF